MIIENYVQALQLATEFLTTKERKNYYETKAIDESFPEYSYMLVQLSDDMVSKIRTLKERYGQDFVNHLQEIIDDEGVISDMFYGDPVDIDLDKICHLYAFKIHELNPDDTVSVHSCDVELSDEEYARLLAWHLCDEHLTINTLRQHDGELYYTIMRAVDCYYFQSEQYLEVDNPYVPTLDEAKADVETIIRQYDIKRTGGYQSIFILK
jgi:hypothetical protein